VRSGYEESADPNATHVSVRRVPRSLFPDAKQNRRWCCTLGKRQELAFADFFLLLFLLFTVRVLPGEVVDALRLKTGNEVV